VDREFGKFFDSLKESGFFDKGYLIVLGDHRKRAPRSVEEVTAFGEASSARVPLLIVGPGVTSGAINSRSFQQADLFTRLDKVLEPESPLTVYPIFLDDPPKDYIVFQREQAKADFNGYLFHLRGTELQWKGTVPTNAKKLEFEVHHQRALSQVRREFEIRFKATPPSPVSGNDLKDE